MTLITTATASVSVLAASPKCINSIQDLRSDRSLQMLDTAGLADIDLQGSTLKITLKNREWYLKSTLADNLDSPHSVPRPESDAHRLGELIRDLLNTQEFEQLVRDPYGQIQIDMSAVSKISAETAGTLFMINKQLNFRFPRPISSTENTPKTERLQLTGVNSEVMSFLRVSGLHRILNISTNF
jgi:hypothetical protein